LQSVFAAVNISREFAMKNFKFHCVRLDLFAWCIFFLVSPIKAATNEIIIRAMDAIRKAAPKAEADPARPIFHVTAPAQWINDPNGPIFHKGYYHMFYQHDPFSDEGRVKFWGHVRSRDLVKWEHLPVALWPSKEAGEDHVYSGCCTTNGEGEPMIFYTSIGRGKSDLEYAEQWAATSDDDLIEWRKHPANPVLSESLHGATKIYDWRDPFVFRDGKQTFMVLGGNLNKRQGGQAVVNIYEAENAELTKWKYRGVLFQHPDREVTSAECPNFFQLGKQWVLFLSPFGKVQYFIGDFDAQTCRFQAKTRGVVDYAGNFYAPNTLLAQDGRRIVWGWIMGFPNGRGWNGCLSLPRLLSVSRDGRLLQKPSPELVKLRQEKVQLRNVRLNNASQMLTIPQMNTLEILAEIDLQTAKNAGLRLKDGGKDSKPIVVSLDGSEVCATDVKAPLELSGPKKKLILHLFLDHSVMEVFANDRTCITRIVPVLNSNITLELFASGGSATFKHVQVWQMKTIW
jgi:beta-fructofuranosidase